VGVRRDERLELSGDGVVSARFELGGQPGLDRRQARLVESRRIGGGERLVRAVSLSCAGLLAGERDASLFPLSRR